MSDELRIHPGASGTPPKVVGLGAPTSVWIYFERAEIPALLAALGDEFARYGQATDIDGDVCRSRSGTELVRWRYQLGELHRMRAGVASELGAGRTAGRFDLLWPTALARGVIHGAWQHAARRAAREPSADHSDAQAALAAAQRTLRAFDAVDGGGLEDVWL